ncbi:MAG: TlpA family protein disulfide reductase [Bacteroidales bacterium]|nr:TlpA family protein disulfide reductase [Bacteroidales bacterium]
MKIKLFFAVVAMIAGAVSLGAQEEAKDLDPQYAVNLIKEGPAPDFTIQGADGKTYSLKDFKGKTLILDFWATWCPDCREEMPQLLALQKKLKGRKDIVMVGVSFDTDPAKLASYVKEKGIGWLQLSDFKSRKESAISDAYHIQWIPTKYVIGPDGKILLATVMQDKVDALVDSLLK